MLEEQADSSPSDPQNKLYDPEVLEPPLSPVSDVVSVFSESYYYESLLKQIPGFETYSYKSTPSTNCEDTLPVRKRRSNPQTPQFLNAGSSPSHSVSIRTSGARQNSISINVLTTVVPQISTISRKRKQLLQLEFKIETVHKKLKRTRECLVKEIEKGDKVLGHNYSNVEDLRQGWQRLSRRLRKHSQELRREEDELEPLQYKLTQAQFDIITLHDNLHASLTGGAKPGDSEASLEDRLFESLGGQLAPDPVVSYEGADGGELYARSLEDVEEIVGKPMTLTSDSEGQGDSHVDNGLKDSRVLLTEERPDSPDLYYDGTEVQLSNGHDGKGLKRTSANKDMNLIHCGSCFPQNSTGPYIDQAAQAHQLLADPALLTIRKTDLQGVLGYRLQDLDRNLDLIGTLQKPVNIGVAQKLSETSLPSVHTRQMISLWTTAMSQNSALETSRTLLYGSKQSEEFARSVSARLASIHSFSKVLLQLVQDVRQLKVPLDAKVNDPLITLNRAGPLLENTPSLKVHVASSTEH